jgi:hypothetical protein
MSALDWAGFFAAITASLTSVGLLIRWVVKSFLSELKPNGGESLSDKIRLEVLPILSEIKADVAEMKGRLDQHLKEGDR